VDNIRMDLREIGWDGVEQYALYVFATKNVI
jgi:hypothetical protein